MLKVISIFVIKKPYPKFITVNTYIMQRKNTTFEKRVLIILEFYPSYKSHYHAVI